MTKFLKKDTLLLLVLAAAGIYDGVRLLGASLPFDDPIGPGKYLIFLSGMLLICGVVSFFYGEKRETIASKQYFLKFRGPVSQLIVVFILYAIATPIIGYLPSSVLFFVFSSKIAGVGSWIRSVILGLAFAGGFIFLFKYIASIPLP